MNEKIYVGQTRYTIEKRWKEHIYNIDRRNQLLYIAMRKYGKENFWIEAIEEVEESELDKKEKEYIRKYSSISPNGYNVTTGGGKFESDNPMFHEEIRKKVSEYFIGDKNPAKRMEVKEKIRASALGKKASEETKMKMSQNNGRYWKGKHLSEETKKKISENHGMRGKFGSLNPNAKTVLQIDKNSGDIISEFDSINSAVRFLKETEELISCYGSNISNVCLGKQKTAYGYIWKFKEI